MEQPCVSSSSWAFNWYHKHSTELWVQLLNWHH